MTRSDVEKSARSENGTGLFEGLGRKLDQRPEVRAAAEAVKKAREQLQNAQQQYEELRAEASKGMEELREKNAGDLMASALDWVRKHPGPGVAAALVCGWFAGRIFRR